MRIRRRFLDRRQIKSSEGELIWELENSYSLSPKLSSSIMMTAKECLLQEYNLSEGQIEVTVIGIEERSGKVIEKMEKKKGIEVVTRGYLHNIGRGQTHKVKIIGMYLDGKTYSEIKLTARHSSGAIKRYIESFTKVVMAQSKGIYERKEISAVTGISEGLVKQYLELIKESKKDKIKSENLKDLINRNSYRTGIKKTAKLYLEPLGAMMRGLL